MIIEWDDVGFPITPAQLLVLADLYAQLGWKLPPPMVSRDKAAELIERASEELRGQLAGGGAEPPVGAKPTREQKNILIEMYEKLDWGLPDWEEIDQREIIRLLESAADEIRVNQSTFGQGW